MDTDCAPKIFGFAECIPSFSLCIPEADFRSIESNVAPGGDITHSPLWRSLVDTEEAVMLETDIAKLSLL